jgi:hypothetical protein
LATVFTMAVASDGDGRHHLTKQKCVVNLTASPGTEAESRFLVRVRVNCAAERPWADDNRRANDQGG